MNRRDLLAAIGGAAFSGYGARAQDLNRSYSVGLLSPGVPLTNETWQVAPILQGLASRGYVLGQNLTIERRGAQGHPELLPQVAAELAGHAAVIVAYGYAAAAAAKAVGNVPVIAFATGDPVGLGLAVSLARPGGSVTGISDVAAELAPKRLSLLKEAVPGLRRVAMLWNAGDAGMTLRYAASAAKATELDLAISPLPVGTPDDFGQAMATMSGNPPDALFVVADSLTTRNRKQIIDFSALKRVPAMFEYDFIVREGGLMSYGPDLGESFDREAALIDRILKGARPQDLPFERPTRFCLALNRRTAATIGLELPYALLVQADEVVE